MDYYQHIHAYIQQNMKPTAVSDLAYHFMLSIYRDNRVPDNKLILPNITAGDIRQSGRVWESTTFVTSLMVLIRHRLVRMIRDEIAAGYTMTTEQLFSLSDMIEEQTRGAEQLFILKMQALSHPVHSNHKSRTLTVSPG